MKKNNCNQAISPAQFRYWQKKSVMLAVVGAFVLSPVQSADAGQAIPGVQAWVARDFSGEYPIVSRGPAIQGGGVYYDWTINPNVLCVQGKLLGPARDGYNLGVSVTYTGEHRMFILPADMTGEVYGGELTSKVNVAAYFISGQVWGNNGAYIVVGSGNATSGSWTSALDDNGSTCSGGAGLEKNLNYRVDVPRGVLPAGIFTLRLRAPAMYFLSHSNSVPISVLGEAALNVVVPFMSGTAGLLTMTGEITVNNYCHLESDSAEINHGTVSGNQAEGNTASTSLRVMCNNPSTVKITTTGLTAGNELLLGTGLKSSISATVNGQSVDFSAPEKDYSLNGASNLINLQSTLHFKAGETLQAGEYNKSFVMSITYQ